MYINNNIKHSKFILHLYNLLNPSLLSPSVHPRSIPKLTYPEV